MIRPSTPRSRAAALLAAVLLCACAAPALPPIPRVQLPPGTPEAPVLTPEQAMRDFRLPAGYRVELVAAEPLVEDPVAIDFDADGRMYVVEMRGYMPDVTGNGELEPVGRVVVLEDLNDDGRMDRRTVFMDSLVLARGVGVLDEGVLISEPPYLWLAKDTNGDLKADTREVVRDDYGIRTGNPELNATGFVWGQDNWIHHAAWPGQLRLRGGKFELRAAPSEGQWGMSMDDYGRIYRNSNEDPLRVDLVPSQYAARNANQLTVRGVYERLTPNVPVYPIHKTPGLNRGYRAETLRPDSTLAHYTAAGSPTVYVGDRLPAELRGSVFVAEPAGNLVGQFAVREEANGALRAERAAERTDFLASTDERFRPVSLASAPDGTLYVVDMYRGIIQHGHLMTGYLKQQVIRRGLDRPTGLGRIYRVVHEGTERGEAPRLSGKRPAQLVTYLSHPNGWWRNTAQRLLVERGDRSVAPALRRFFREARDPRFRLHALWTLDGLESVDRPTLDAALADASPHVRAAAIRVAEPWLATAEHPLATAVKRLADDPHLAVRRQLTASLGELPRDEREPALAAMVARYGDDPVVADLVTSALQGREVAFLERIVGRGGAVVDPSPTLQSLAAATLRSRSAVGMQRIVAWVGDASLPRAQRVALLAGVAPSASQAGAGQLLELPEQPAALMAAVESADTAISSRARRLAGILAWPGKPAPAREVRPLTAEELRRYEAGRAQFNTTCAPCHQVTGTGMTGVAKSLVGSKWVVGTPASLIRIVLHGKEGEMLMPPAGAPLSDEQVAAVLTYIRRSWGNEAAPVSAADVYEVRGATLGRDHAWTEAELQ